MVPKGWKSVYLNDISEKIMVGIASAATHAYCDDGIRMLRNLNIKDGWIDDSDILFVNEEYEKQHKNKRLKTGDILTVRTGYPGVSAVVPEKYNNAQCFTSLITRLNTSNALPAYICRFINSEYGKKYITSGEAGGAQKNVNAAILKKMRIPLPPLLEQQKIGNILSTWDKAISTTERLIENSTQQKKALMQQLLTGKKRLLDESGNRFEGEWEKYPVGDICQSIVPGRNKPKEFDGDIPWVTTPEFQGRYIPSKLQKNYISQSVIDECGAKLVPEGAVVIAAVGDLGLTAIASETVVLNQQLHAFICGKKVYNEYLFYWLSYQKPYMESIASKTTIQYMNKKNCESIPVGLPTLEEQQKIATVLTNADKEIELLEQQLADLQQEKKALMQVLLTGKKRVVDGGVLDGY
ncbi:restriction endonuclease subunit S [Psychrobacter sp. NG25]|uniref:restriction endonuclease subunit S n=1 Tax=Psychrobacter sp. NG25 TaxID=2782005 RepID=UPI00188386BA|nr:restriction endonuclease subunit S [Psychrobacter sp. NG25]MBF0658515.1 restriction endonuclease subunit S [Psychrobacter sp. NG25]